MVVQLLQHCMVPVSIPYLAYPHHWVWGTFHPGCLFVTLSILLVSLTAALSSPMQCWPVLEVATGCGGCVTCCWRGGGGYGTCCWRGGGGCGTCCWRTCWGVEYWGRSLWTRNDLCCIDGLMCLKMSHIVIFIFCWFDFNVNTTLCQLRHSS